MSLTVSCKNDDVVANEQTVQEMVSQKVFINGRIYTVNNAQPWAEAMIVQDTKIVFIGTTVQAQANAESDAQIIDL
jgi:predicted amidohydrolase YtcJ